MGLRATVEGQFLSAELRPWEMNGKRGESWSISLLQEEDSVRLTASGDTFKESDFPERMASVVCEVDLFKDGGSYKPKIVKMVAAGKVQAVKPATATG